jgi:eukaryotic-like serine/threonine-protein kinase
MTVARTAMETPSEDERAFLQQRLRLFAKWAFILALTTDVVQLANGGWQEVYSAGWAWDRLTAIILASMWAVCAWRDWSHRFLRGMDALAAGAITLGVAVMGRYLAANLLPNFEGSSPPTVGLLGAVDAFTSMMIMLGGALMFTFRAAVIPSSPWLTMVITGVLGAPYVVFPVVFEAAVDGEFVIRGGPVSGEGLVNYIIWWAIVTVACTAISAVIYGLRREVRAAQSLGQYTLVEKLGEGGMGAVYRAQHARLRRPTAIKLLPPGRLSDEAAARFESEVQLTASLTHPNTITVFDYGRTDDGVLYYAMEYLDGATLEEVVGLVGALPAERVVRILRQTAGALQEAHEVGLMHRDIKPANIMLTRQGTDDDAAKLLDFGLARTLESPETSGMTKDNRLVGTPLYMAPEVIRDAAAMSERSDLYALGAVGYFLLSGTPVFDADTIVEICAHHLHTVPEPLTERAEQAVPQELADLVMQCLAKSPDERPASAAEIAERLDDVVLDRTWTDRNAHDWWRQFQPRLKAQRQAPGDLEHRHLTVTGL